MKKKKLKLKGKKLIQLLYRRVASSGNRVSDGGGSVCGGKSPLDCSNNE